jgi:hypothetical protein
VNSRPSFFLPSKIEQEDTALVSPCTLIPPTGPRSPVLRGRSRVPSLLRNSPIAILPGGMLSISRLMRWSSA